MNDIRIGHGYDVHRLVPGRRLIIGGVRIPYEKGLLGHSDADVLVHSIIDALMGALAIGDIGTHFPDAEEKYKDADSLELLSRVKELVISSGYDIGNIDSTVLAQNPRLSPYISGMREQIALALDCPVNRVSVKATTEEGLGFTGNGNGIAAHAVCIIKQVPAIKTIPL